VTKMKSMYGFLLISILLAIFAFVQTPPFVLIFLAITFMYVGFSESWNLVGGYMGYLSLGHGALFGVSAYTVAILWASYKFSPLISPFIGALFAMLIAMVIGYPTMRLRGYYFALATLALPLIAQGLVLSVPAITAGGQGIPNIFPPEIPFNLRPHFYYGTFLAYMFACVVIAYKAENSKFGRGLVALRDDEDAAAVCGINGTRLKVEAFMVSGFLTGIAGGLFASYLTYVSPSAVFGIILSVTPVLMTILGGRGRWLGPVIGGITLNLLSNYISYSVLSVLNELVLGVVLILIVLMTPKGILGVVSDVIMRNARRKGNS
jgi:branched-chain amino acid transport system permease protein